ncbi:hypothetical protein RSAG8_13782, partial [Rhizoctonia solani AG-8 WAC10335]
MILIVWLTSQQHQSAQQIRGTAARGECVHKVQ